MLLSARLGHRPAPLLSRASASSRRTRIARRAAPAVSPIARRRPLRSVCSLDGASDSLGSDNEDSYDYSLSRELDRRSQRFERLAEHLDLLYSASQTTASSVEKCECCRGCGEQECNWCHGTGAMTVGEMLYCSEGGCTPCPVCRGTGQCKCPNCRGTGKRASWMARGPRGPQC